MLSARSSTADASPSRASRIRISIYSLRVLTGTIALVGIIAGLTFFLTDGLHLAAQEATSMTDASRTKLLDRYNTYSGGLASIVSMPFQTFAAMLLPIFFVSFCTSLVLGNGDSVLAKWSPIVIVAAVSWMLGQSMNALNVQFEAAKVEFIISSSDLSAEGITAFSFTMTNVTNSANLAGIPSNETILRAAAKPITANHETTCTADYGVLYGNPEPSIRFGFPLNSWLEYMLPTSVSSDASFTYSTSVDFSSQEIDSSVLPGGDVGDTAVLFSHAYWLFRQSIDTSISVVTMEDIYEATKASDATEFLAHTQTFMSNTSSDAYAGAFNLSVPDMSIQFASFELTPQIKFDAVTFEIPSTVGALEADDSGWDTERIKDGIYSRSIYYICNDLACVLETPSDFYEDQIRMVRVCMTESNGAVEDFNAFSVPVPASAESVVSCPYPSNSSVYVVSIARQLVIDEVNLNEWVMSIKNPRFKYTITVGRLSWETSDLAEIYGATCAFGVNCDGLYFPLSNGQHVVVDAEHLPLPYKLLYPYNFKDWQVLALTNTMPSDTTQGNVFIPGDYPLAADSLPWTGFNGSVCSFTGSDYLNDIVQRHIYSRDPVQPAYTSALFWLFQNGAVKDIELAKTYSTTASTTKASNNVKLSFAGNRRWVSPIASIPQTSAWITYGACVIILVMGVLVTFRSSESQSAISDRLTPHHVADLIVNSAKYPPLLLRAEVYSENSSGTAKPTAANGGNGVQAFEILEMTLHHRTNDRDQKVVISRNAVPGSA